MATSGLVCAIHSFDFSKPEKTRFQYGSSVCLLSIAAPIAGTCDDATPAMILATLEPHLLPRFLAFAFAARRDDGFDATFAFDVVLVLSLGALSDATRLLRAARPDL